MPAPFLEILTRTFLSRTVSARPNYLKRNQESLKILNDPDWTQRLIVDEEGRGVEWANQNLGTIEAVGQWVWVLDDDDVCCYADLIGDLRRITRAEKPDVVMVRVYHSKWLMLPPNDMWEQKQRPILGKIGPSNVIVKRQVWNAHRDGWTPTYAGDFWYVNHLWDAGLKFSWLPVIAANQTQQLYGKAENA